MPGRRVTSKQVAEKAGVSQTTVSFVLNNVEEANISEETARRVLQVARELGYVPDKAARALARGVSDNIGLVLAQPHEQVFLDDYIPNIITGITRVTREKGLRILVELTDEVSESNTYLDMAHGREVAGLIVSPQKPTQRDRDSLKALARDGFPIVTLHWLDDAVHSVTADHVDGSRRAVEHLIQLGHQRIALISYAPRNRVDGATWRVQAYREVLERHGIPHDEALVRFGNYDPETGYTAAEELLDLPEPPTAIFCMNDTMAFGAMTAIQERGLRIPQDIAIVAFDDIRLARYTTPTLTTIHAPDIEHGRLAASMLVQLINKQPLEQDHVVLKTQLVVRDSCGARIHQARSET